MSSDLANWLGIAFVFGAGSFFMGWTVCNVQWNRWLESTPPRVDVIDTFPPVRKPLEYDARAHERMYP
jgi:hypothetical protein